MTPRVVDNNKLHTNSKTRAVLALLASVLGFMLHGAALTGGADGMTDPDMLGLLWQTPVGDATDRQAPIQQKLVPAVSISHRSHSL